MIHAAHDLRLEDVPEPMYAADEVLVQLGAGGICGSDLHYFHHGGVGDFRLRQPMTLGHEVAGEIVAVGAEVTRVRVGDRVAVNPSRPCLECEQCLAGHSNLCPNMRFFGSAARFPHVQGAFAERFTARQDQCELIPAGLPYAVAACAEPLAVTLHAVAQAGPLLGQRVLIVVDNCEHVQDAVAPLVEAVLKRAPAVTVVATSREGLRLGAEHLWPVPTLDVTAGVASGAVALFVNERWRYGPASV